MAKFRYLLLSVAVILAVLILVLATAFMVLSVRTNSIDDDYSEIYEGTKYSRPILIDGVDVIKQDISCGYAVIEMFSGYLGGSITEETLMSEYGKVITSTGNSFEVEMNKRFPAYNTTMHKYLTNSKLLDMVYDSLSRGVPVPFEWAAKLGDEWTLHYSLVVGMDVKADKVIIANPYGYMEELSIADFIARTNFEAMRPMPSLYFFAFAFGVFEKNTIFIVTEK